MAADAVGASARGAAWRSGAVPCRPRLLILSCLFPSGRVLAQALCRPPEAFPSAADVWARVAKEMRDPTPPPAGAGGASARTPARRPGKVVTPHRELVEGLYNTFAAVGIECTVLSEPPGIDKLVAAYSDKLVANDVAARHPEIHARASLLDAVPRATAGVVGALYGAGARFLAAAPWRAFPERQAFELTVDHATAPLEVAPGLTARAKERVWCACVSCAGQNGARLRGLVVFWSRMDLEAQLLPPGPVRGAGDGAPAAAPDEVTVFRPAPTPRCAHSGARADEAAGLTLKRTRPRTFDARTGVEIVYADGKAQRAHWRSVKKFSKPLSDRDDPRRRGSVSDPARGKTVARQVSLFFEHPTRVPFAELDARSAHGWPLGACAHEPVPPFPTACHAEGGRTGPVGDALDLVWLERAARVLTALHARGEAGDADFAKFRNNLDPDAEGIRVEIALECGGEGKAALTESVLVRNAPVYAEREVRDYFARKEQAAGT